MVRWLVSLVLGIIETWNSRILIITLGTLMIVDSNLKAAHDDLMMRSKILQKYSLASVAGFVICLIGLKYAPAGSPALLIVLAVIFGISAGLKLFFAFKWQREARAMIGQ
jgi:hypothetical protein